MSTTCRIVVDASGRKTLVGNQMKWRIQDDHFDQYAIHTWFNGYDRRCMASNKQTQGDFIFIHFLPITNTWVWQIPITEQITSIGVVTQKKNFAKSKESREKFFWECIKSRPELYEGLKAQGSEQMHPFKDEGDYSYAMKQLAGDRCVLVGDAGRFVDPIFSTGVSIALNCSRFAHKDIIGALETGNFSREAFGTYEATLKTRHQELVQLHHRLLPAERAVHGVRAGSALSSGRPEAAARRRLRGCRAASADPHAQHRAAGGARSEPRAARIPGRPHGRTRFVEAQPKQTSP